MIAACAVHVPPPPASSQVIVIRDGRRMPAHRLPFLRAGDEVRARAVTLAYAGNRFTATRADFRLACRRLAIAPRPESPRTAVLAMTLHFGRVRVSAATHSRRALVLTPEALAFAPQPRTTFVIERSAATATTRTWTLDRRLVVARASDPSLRIDARVTYTAISDTQRIRLDVWPFGISRLQRPPTPAEHLPAYWADGLPCSVGCAAPDTVPGWPLRPFGDQHALRAGINELRPANFHVGIDIEARDAEPVFAIQSGIAHIRYPASQDVNVDVGRFDYWHIKPTVTDGQHVTAYRTEVGTVLLGERHLAVSEGTPGDYLNPLRPGGSIQPYHDHEPPIIGMPRIFADGTATVAAFDPQSYVARGPYETPVLAPSSLAWRLYDAGGRPLTGLLWAMRGSQNYPPVLKSTIYAPGAANPGYRCFLTRRRCIPDWAYRLAGGLTEPLPLAGLRPGRYRLTIYAWDWAGNTAALDDWITLPLRRAALAPAAAEFGPLAAQPG